VHTCQLPRDWKHAPGSRTWQTNPTFLPVEVEDKVIAYTGDGEWTDEMAQMGQGADLVIAECYYYAKQHVGHADVGDEAPRSDDEPVTADTIVRDADHGPILPAPAGRGKGMSVLPRLCSLTEGRRRP
jgi:hypothetical protein